MGTVDLVPARNSSVVATSPTYAISAQDYMPVFDIERAAERRNALVAFVNKIMTDGLDYGVIPGSTKPCLLKPGAEKLCTFFGLVAKQHLESSIEDWGGAQFNGEPLFYYHYKCRLFRNKVLIGEGDGSCNSWESRYRYRWVDESYLAINGLNSDQLLKRGGSISEFTFAVDKAETSGKFAKPAEYWQRFKDAIADGTARSIRKKLKDGSEKPAWEIDGTQYRVLNTDIHDTVNTCMKIAQKRALIAATLNGVNASEFFTQDLDDLTPIVTGEDHPPTPPVPPPHAASKPAAPAPANTAHPAAAWSWQLIQPSFEELKKQLGEVRYNELLGEEGYLDISKIPNSDTAKEIYKVLLFHVRNAAKKAEVPTGTPAPVQQAAAPAPEKQSVPIPEGHPILLMTKDMLFKKMDGQKAGIETFEMLLGDMDSIAGTEVATESYMGILRSYGVEHANQFKTMGTMRQAAVQLLAKVQELASSVLVTPTTKTEK